MHNNAKMPAKAKVTKEMIVNGAFRALVDQETSEAT